MVLRAEVCGCAALCRFGSLTDGLFFKYLLLILDDYFASFSIGKIKGVKKIKAKPFNLRWGECTWRLKEVDPLRNGGDVNTCPEMGFFCTAPPLSPPFWT